MRMLTRRGTMAAVLAIVGLLGVGLCGARPARAEPLRIYAAGSLTGAMKALIAASGLPADSFAEPVFGPAGLLGDRLANGEAADILASADMAQPERLAAAKPGLVVVPFAGNRMCVAAKPSLGLAPETMLTTLLDPEARLATSTPKADPGGDYAEAVFAKAEAVHPGAEKILKGKALHLVGGPTTMVPVDGHSPAGSIFVGDRTDMLLYYCSSAAALLKEVPGLVNLPVPDALEVHPIYGLAVNAQNPEATRFALFVLSTKGQAILSDFGFLPLTPAH